MAGRAALIAILIVAGVARFWAIDFCLPAPICRPDEEAVASLVPQFFARDFNPRFFDWPTLFMYAVAAGTVVYFKIGLWLDWFRGEYHFLQTISNFQAPVFLIARLLSATAGVVSVWLVYRLAARLFTDRIALIAAAFLALAFLHVRDSHFGVTDITASCFALASVLYLIRFDRSGIARDWVVCAIWAGLATSTKYGAALVTIPALFVIVWPRESDRSGWTDRLRRSVGFVLVMGSAFALTSPYCVIAFDQFIGALGGVSTHLANPHGVMIGRGWLVHLTSSLRYGLGLPLLVAGMAGCLLLIRRSPRDAVIVLLFPIVYYFVVGSGYTAFARYAVPIVPFLCLTAALAVSALARSIAKRIGRDPSDGGARVVDRGARDRAVVLVGRAVRPPPGPARQPDRCGGVGQSKHPARSADRRNRRPVDPPVPQDRGTAQRLWLSAVRVQRRRSARRADRADVPAVTER